MPTVYPYPDPNNFEQVCMWFGRVHSKTIRFRSDTNYLLILCIADDVHISTSLAKLFKTVRKAKYMVMRDRMFDSRCQAQRKKVAEARSLSTYDPYSGHVVYSSAFNVAFNYSEQVRQNSVYTTEYTTQNNTQNG